VPSAAAGKAPLRVAAVPRARVRVAATLVLAVAGAPARAHVGAVVALANFSSPAAPTSMQADAGRIVAPYSWASADQRYTVVWQDGDTDPTGRFVFWYMDHHPTFQVSVDQIEDGSVGAIQINDAINLAGGYWVSCFCSPDAGVTCPSDPRSATGNCANQFSWDTSTLTPGAYWIVAVNTDPPFHIYNAALAPLIVVHGGTAPPAAIFIRPDGYDAYDTRFRAQWLATGKAPLKFDLAYGVEAFANVLDAPQPIASGITPFVNSDGSLGYDWDVSKLTTGNSYYLRLKVTDGNGVSSFTDSHYGVQIFHGGGTITPPAMDMSAPVVKKPRSGCSFAGDGDWRGPTLALLLLATVGAYFSRRRAG
jgi:MYXO-CTERM domain-containing protein